LLRELRFSTFGGPPARVVERRGQPLDCIAATWQLLRQGRCVAVKAEPGASLAGVRFLQPMVPALGDEALSVDLPDAPLAEASRAWVEAGVERARPRVAWVRENADPELAAYLLARASLRRSGLDPRGVRHVVVPKPSDRLERHLRRLWVGAKIGPPHDHGAFAGPVSEEQARRFEQGVDQLASREGTTVLVARGRLEPSGTRGVCLAPALLAVDGVGPGPVALEGPMLVLHRADAGEAQATLDGLMEGAGGVLHVGTPPRGTPARPHDRHFEGALLLERIPPGLPKPRP
jgi:hypothetical protein